MVAFTKVLLLSAASLISALPTQPLPRSAADIIIADINLLDASVQALTGSINSYQGGLLGDITSAPSIVPAFTAVHTSNRKAYADASLPSSLSAADTQRLIAVVHNGLSVDNPAAVAATKAKRAAFTQGGLKGAILSSLKLLLDDHNSLSAVLASKAPQDAATQAAIQREVKVIADALQDGINYYS